MLRVGVALLAIGLVSGTSAGAARAETSSETEEAERPEAAPSPGKQAQPTVAASKSRVASKKRTRKSRTRARAKVSGRVIPESRLRQAPLPQPSGNLHLVSLASNEALKINIYNEDGSYNVEALKELATILSHVYDQYGGRRIEVVSGFRNQRRESSYHYQASAIDIRIPGVKPTKLRSFIETLDEGGMGIGLYPRVRFVHIDVRPPPSYRWIDYSSSDPNAPDKRPPRGFKKPRKPVS
jgi:uncharacterized protein YcbK (DUF882 family)